MYGTTSTNDSSWSACARVSSPRLPLRQGTACLFQKRFFFREKVRSFAEIEKFRRAVSIAGGRGKRDVGAQMLDLTACYANDDDAAKVVREGLAKIIRAS
jgi:hypothetical protein